MMKKAETIALALEPKAETFGYIPLMKAAVDHLVVGSLLKAKQLAQDLEAAAPQVVWVEIAQRDEFEAKLAGIEIGTREVSKEEADRISIENKPVRGSVDLQIRTRDSQINSEMVRELKELKLISGCRMGGNANDIFHWKDDRWYQDFHLAVFKDEYIPQIERLIGGCGYIVVRAPKKRGRS